MVIGKPGASSAANSYKYSLRKNRPLEVMISSASWGSMSREVDASVGVGIEQVVFEDASGIEIKDPSGGLYQGGSASWALQTHPCPTHPVGANFDERVAIRETLERGWRVPEEVGHGGRSQYRWKRWRGENINRWDFDGKRATRQSIGGLHYLWSYNSFNNGDWFLSLCSHFIDNQITQHTDLLFLQVEKSHRTQIFFFFRFFWKRIARNGAGKSSSEVKPVLFFSLEEALSPASVSWENELQVQREKRARRQSIGGLIWSWIEQQRIILANLHLTSTSGTKTSSNYNTCWSHMAPRFILSQREGQAWTERFRRDSDE
jgi:hypothetical protein